jgi:hypothetical protein
MLELEEQGIISDARRIVDEAEKRGITLRLLGGVAFKLRCESCSAPLLLRSTADIDLAGLSRQRSSIEKLLVGFGFSAGFNAFRYERLIFHDECTNRKVDVFLDNFQMCHKLRLKERLALDEKTLTLADLLLTKLQVYEFTEREYKDVLALFSDFGVVLEESRSAINGKYIAKLCSADWGLFRTLTLNLERLERGLPSYVPSSSKAQIVKDRINYLKRLVNLEPKSTAWKLRSLIGDRVKWYNLPEEQMTNTLFKP